MRLFFLILILFIGGSFGCIDKINVELPEDFTQTDVIEGYIEMDSHYYHVWSNATQTESITEEVFTHYSDASIELWHNGSFAMEIGPGQPIKIPIDSFHLVFGGSSFTSNFQLYAEFNGST